MLSGWVQAGLPPDSFWEQTAATYNSAMGGAIRARDENFTLRRDLALMTAYFGGQCAQADFSKMPDWPQFLRSMTQPARRLSSAEIVARFAAMAEAGFDVTTD